MGIFHPKEPIKYTYIKYKLLINNNKLVRPAGLEPTPQASETCTLSS